jgi:hypothetical protein
MLDTDLREGADFYINDETRRLAPGSPCFHYDVILLDTQNHNRLHRFWFVVNDEAAKYGVLKIEYGEEG